jgi:hypothetical protein
VLRSDHLTDTFADADWELDPILPPADEALAPVARDQLHPLERLER